MCFYGIETCTVFNENRPVARKPHQCEECGRTIPKGEQYVRIGSLYDGSWSTYKAHACCVTLTKYIQLVHCDQYAWMTEALQEACYEHRYEVPGFELRLESIQAQYPMWERR